MYLLGGTNEIFIKIRGSSALRVQASKEEEAKEAWDNPQCENIS
jgi:hypothetical protein